MKLYTLERQGSMADPHDFIRLSRKLAPGSGLKAKRQTVRGHHQRMIAGYGQRVGQGAKDPAAIVADNGGFAMHHLPGARNTAAKSLGDGLMPQTDAQDRDSSGEMPDNGK